MVDRVKTHSFKRVGSDYVPFIKMPDGSEREVLLSSLPGSQEALMSAPETEVLYAGGRGPGKTRATLQTYLQYVGCGWGAQWKGIIIRPSLSGFDEVRSLTEQMIRPLFPGAEYNVNKHIWNWPTGEELKLGYFEGNQDFRQYQGSSRQWICFDELTQFADDSAYKNMLSVLRPSGGAGVPLMVRSTTNPNGPGHNWVRRRFHCDDLHIQGYRVGPHIPKDDEGLTRRVIYGHLAENLRLLTTHPDYLENLKQSAARAGELEAWTLGSWNITSGGLFDADMAETSAFCLLPEIPARAFIGKGRLVCSYDFGDSSPFAMIYGIISDGSDVHWNGQTHRFVHGDVIVFKEIYGCLANRPNTGVRWTVEQQRQAFFAYEMESGIRYRHPVTQDWCRHSVSAVADDQIFNSRLVSANVANSIADEFAERFNDGTGSQRGIRFEAADKSPGTRVQGWQAIRGRLHATVPSENGVREREGLFFCRSCEHLIRTLSTLARDEKDPEDCPGRSEDHLPDALRYLLRSNHQSDIVYSGSVSGFNAARRANRGAFNHGRH